MRAVTLSLLLTMGCALPGLRAQVIALTPTDLCSRATRVVVGGVQKLECRWQGQAIVTDVTIVPTENLKGTGSGAFMITVPGGTIGQITLRASEAPRFTVGEHVVLFIKQGSSPCDVYGWFRGKFTIVDGQIRELVNTSFTQFRDQLVGIIEHL